ncbi:MAG: MFS transporter, partial [Promethearchaeota archaeon]
LPQVMFTPIAGVLIDKWNRKHMIICVDSIQAFLTLIIIILSNLLSGLTGIILMICINSCRGICQAFHYPATSAVIPTMIPKEKLSRINGLNTTFNQVLQIIGPALAAFLLIEFPLTVVLYIDVITFLIALIPLMFIKIPIVKCEKKEKKSKFKDDFKQGFNIIIKMPQILILIILFMGLNFLLQPFSVLFSYFINVTHGGSVLDYAFIMGLFNVGFLLGGILMAIKKKWKKEIRTIFLSILFVMIGYYFLSISPKSAFLYIGVIFAFMGLNIPITNSLFQTLLQTKVPNDKYGRVFSIYVSLSWLISPLGKISVGIFGEIIPIQVMFFTCSFLGFGLLTFFYLIMHLTQKQKNITIVVNEDPLEIKEA